MSLPDRMTCMACCQNPGGRSRMREPLVQNSAPTFQPQGRSQLAPGKRAWWVWHTHPFFPSSVGTKAAWWAPGLRQQGGGGQKVIGLNVDRVGSLCFDASFRLGERPCWCRECPGGGVEAARRCPVPVGEVAQAQKTPPDALQVEEGANLGGVRRVVPRGRVSCPTRRCLAVSVEEEHPLGEAIVVVQDKFYVRARLRALVHGDSVPVGCRAGDAAARHQLSL